MRIDAKGLHYKELNEKIYQAVQSGSKEIILDNVNGQRYIADGLKSNVKITINGVPGNDLAAFMDGPEIKVNANAQDGVGNTMNAGKIVVAGDAGDIIGYGMRGGKIFIKGNAGYRVGIHLKAYKDLLPVIVIGGSVGDFLGEYMAGGIIIVLGLNKNNKNIAGTYIGTGMHAGIIYLKGKVEKFQLGKEVGPSKLNSEDHEILKKYLKEFCDEFNFNLNEIYSDEFIKLTPVSHRPYGKLYAY